jgi:hypothetical protein
VWRRAPPGRRRASSSGAGRGSWTLQLHALESPARRRNRGRNRGQSPRTPAPTEAAACGSGGAVFTLAAVPVATTATNPAIWRSLCAACRRPGLLGLVRASDVHRVRSHVAEVLRQTHAPPRRLVVTRVACIEKEAAGSGGRGGPARSGEERWTGVGRSVGGGARAPAGEEKGNRGAGGCRRLAEPAARRGCAMGFYGEAAPACGAGREKQQRLRVKFRLTAQSATMARVLLWAWLVLPLGCGLGVTALLNSHKKKIFAAVN